MRNGLYDGLGTLCLVLAFENARADKHTIAAELHHERSISRRRNTASGKVDDGQAFQTGRFLEQMEGRLVSILSSQFTHLDLTRVRVQLIVAHVGNAADLSLYSTLVAHSLDNVSGASLALSTDHSSTLTDAAQRLTQVAAATDEWHLEVVLVDVVRVVRGSKHFTLVE